MGGYVKNRHIKGSIDSHKLNHTVVERFLAPTAGATDGATAGGMDILAYTDASSGSLNVTAGAFVVESPDVPRGLEIFISGAAATDVTGGTITFSYWDAGGRGLLTKTVTGISLAATGPNRTPFPDGVSRLQSISGSFAGGETTVVDIALAQSPSLALANDPTPGGAIIHESGQATPPVTGDDGLFVPGTTLDGSTDVEIRVHYGAVN